MVIKELSICESRRNPQNDRFGEANFLRQPPAGCVAIHMQQVPGKVFLSILATESEALPVVLKLRGADVVQIMFVKEI